MTVTVNISTSSGLDLRWSTLYNLFANSPIQVGGSGAEFTTIDSGAFNGQDADAKFIIQGSGFTYSGAFPDIQLTGGTITGITMQTEAGVTLATFSGFSISAETFMSAMNTYTDGHAPPPSGDGNPDSSGLDGIFRALQYNATGGGGNDTLEGGNLADTVVGGAGNDIAVGGPGADSLDGGSGTLDRASYITSTSGLTVDLLVPANNTGDAVGDTYANIEGLEGSNFNDVLRGNNSSNFLIGGAGADTLDGRGGSDTAAYLTATAGVTASLANSAINTGDAAGDTYISIENLFGSTFNDVLMGDSSDNFLNGRGGADALDGGAGGDYADYFLSPIGITVDLANPLNNTGEAAGDTYVSIERVRGSAFNDVLRGNEFSNTFRGGLGADILDGGSGVDFASYSDSSVGVTASLANPGSNSGEAAGDVYISIEALRGGNFADTLIGDAGDNFLQGGPGADTLDGGAGGDYADYISSTIGITVDLANPLNNTGEAAGDTYVSIERVRGSAFNDVLRGDEHSNTLRGGLGADILDGGAGLDFASHSDSSVGVTASLANPESNTGEAAGDVYISIEALRGSNFADTLIGDAGDNFLQGGPGADTLHGGSGFDLADYFSAASAVTVDLSTPSNNTGEAAGDTFTAIDGIRGSAFNDTLRGNDGDNSIIGGAGDDTLSSGAGDDTLSGGAGDDTLDGGQDIDTLVLSGNRADYAVTGAPGFMTIADSVANRDGTDTVINIEFVQFADGTFAAADLINQPPVITSDGGGDTATVPVAENSTAVTTVSAADPDGGQTLTFSITGGADADFFTIDSVTGALAFLSAPDFEAPADAGGDNVYDVTVQVSDGAGGIDTQALSVTIANVAGISPPASDAATITGTGEEDVLIGLGAANNLQGLGGNDILTGGGGSDTLDGGAGNDTLVGGTGNDTLGGGVGSDTFNYTFGDGADTVDGGADLDGLNIIGTSAADALNVIFNGTSITDFEGGTVTGVESIAADFFGGVDTLTYAGTTAEVAVDLSTGVASGFASIAGIENVTGGSGNDTVTGDALVNTLNGGAGNDTLNGGLGNDTLVGGAGNDTLVGGTGNDAMNGGAGIDVFVFGPGFGNDTISGFDANPAGGQDLLDVSALGINAGNFAARVSIVDLGADTLVTIDGTDTIMLQSVNGAGANAITQLDFIF